jgi:hypothetical protein
MVMDSGGLSAGRSGMGAGGGICCAWAGKAVQRERRKANERARKAGLRRTGIMATRVADASVSLQLGFLEKYDLTENCTTPGGGSGAGY